MKEANEVIKEQLGLLHTFTDVQDEDMEALFTEEKSRLSGLIVMFR